jgi:molybdenum cofactor synthesis domain-containing protein
MSADIRIALVTVSNRAAAGVYDDRSGPILAEGLRKAGFTVVDPHVVPDGEPVRDILRELVGRYDVIVTNGGTGISPTYRTPEMTRAVIDFEIPGIAEALRSQGVAAGIATAVLSRGIAGVAAQTLIVNVPGSPGAARDAIDVLVPLIPHAISQLSGGDHPRVPS